MSAITEKEEQVGKAAIAAIASALQLAVQFTDRDSKEILEDCTRRVAEMQGLERDEVAVMVKALLRDEEAMQMSRALAEGS